MATPPFLEADRPLIRDFYTPRLLNRKKPGKNFRKVDQRVGAAPI
jgi:hypothetical protein